MIENSLKKSDKPKANPRIRALSIYEELCEGKIVTKNSEADKFSVDPHTIALDISDIKNFLSEKNTLDSGDSRNIEYNRSKKSYVMTGKKSAYMDNGEILAVSKILLESRAFIKEEINNILDKMIEGCVPLKQSKQIKKLIANEKEHYVELENSTSIIEKIWGIGEEISNKKYLNIKYKKQSNEEVERLVEPLAILFSEYYFYLNAYIVDRDEKGKIKRKYEHPAVFRIDKILKYKACEERYKEESKRFEEGDFRKRVQFMYTGKLLRVRFKYTGKSIDAIRDRLPAAKFDEKPGYVLVSAEVYGNGILKWLLTQGTMVEVLAPEELREEMRNTLKAMSALYD